MTRAEQKEMSNRIKNRRKELCHTQESFSELIGVTVSSYTKIENAFQKPALDTLITIAQHLDLSLDYLVFGTEERKPKEVCSADLLQLLLDEADVKKLQYVSDFLAKMAKMKGRC